jgi:ubiquinone/menaquinone biosynthesis C-methylase UbiE
MAKTAAFEAHLDRYEAWFEKNIFVYQAELRAIKSFLPPDGKGLEIGVGSGLFAAPLGIRHGVEPSRTMIAKARERGIDVTYGVAEALPFEDAVFDFALMVTTVCFLDDMDAAFNQTNRVLKPGGTFVIGFVDKNSPLGKAYDQYKKQSVFYKEATFYTVNDLLAPLTKAGFVEFSFAQTVFGLPSDIAADELVKPGYGECSFVVIKAMKMK